MSIETQPFGTTGIEVSRIGFGAWQLVRSEQWPTGPTREEGVRLVRAALDAGITFFDTAPGYADGHSEPTLGEALRGIDRDRFVLCTKFGYRPDSSADWSASQIRSSIELSAERMGVDHIDIVVLHNPPPEVVPGGEHYEVLAALRDKGLIRAFGTSLDSAADLDAVLTSSSSTALEVRVSALFQETWEALERAGAAGVGTIAKCAMESGWLSGRYTRDSVFTDVRSRWSADDVALRAQLVGEFRELLPAGVGLVAGSLAFVLANSGVSTVIPGTRTLEHLRTSVEAAAVRLPAETVQAVRSWYAERIGAEHLGW